MQHSGELRTTHNHTEDTWTQMLQHLFEINQKDEVLHSRKPTPAHDQTSHPRISVSQIVPLSFGLRPHKHCGFFCADASLIYVGHPSCPCTPLLKCLATVRVLNTVSEAALGMPTSQRHAAFMAQLMECTFFPSPQAHLEPKSMFGRCFIQCVCSKSLPKLKKSQGDASKVVKNNITHKKAQSCFNNDVESQCCWVLSTHTFIKKWHFWGTNRYLKNKTPCLKK